MTMATKKDKSPDSRMTGKRRGDGVPEVIFAPGAGVPAPPTSL